VETLTQPEEVACRRAWNSYSSGMQATSVALEAAKQGISGKGVMLAELRRGMAELRRGMAELRSGMAELRRGMADMHENLERRLLVGITVG